MSLSKTKLPSNAREEMVQVIKKLGHELLISLVKTCADSKKQPTNTGKTRLVDTKQNLHIVSGDAFALTDALKKKTTHELNPEVLTVFRAEIMDGIKSELQLEDEALRVDEIAEAGKNYHQSFFDRHEKERLIEDLGTQAQTVVAVAQRVRQYLRPVVDDDEGSDEMGSMLRSRKRAREQDLHERIGGMLNVAKKLKSCRKATPSGRPRLQPPGELLHEDEHGRSSLTYLSPIRQQLEEGIHAVCRSEFRLATSQTDDANGLEMRISIEWRARRHPSKD